MIISYLVIFLVCSVYARPPTIFFHAFIDERNEYTVVMDQMQELKRNFDLSKYNVVVVSNDKTAVKHASFLGFNFLHHNESSFNEIDTLKYIHRYCNIYKNETFPVLYIHNKGGKYPCITSYFTRSIDMEALVKNADLCLSVLNENINNNNNNVVCGSRFSPIPYPHFNGNMWWTTSSYIAELIVPSMISLNYTSLTETSSLYGLNRYFSERWILNYYYYIAYDVLPENGVDVLYNPIYYYPLDTIQYKISKSPVFTLPLLAQELYSFVDGFYTYKLDTIIQSKLYYSYNIPLYLYQPLQWCVSLLEKEKYIKNVNLTGFNVREIDLQSHFDYCRIRANFSDFLTVNYININREPVFNHINKTKVSIIAYITEVHNTSQIEFQLKMLLDSIKTYKKKVNIYVKSSGSIPNELLEKIKKMKLISSNIEVLSVGAESIYESLYSAKTYCSLESQNNTSLLFYPIMSTIEDNVFNESMKLIKNTVLNFTLCLKYLNNKNISNNNYDVCGIQYNLVPFRQYLWNMIWMSCKYVRTLDHPMLYLINSNIYREIGYSMNQYSYYRYFLSNPHHKAISLVSYPVLQFGRYFPDLNYTILPHESPSLLEIHIDSYISLQNGYISPNVYSLVESLIDLHVLKNVTKLIPYLTNEMRNLTFNDLVNKTRYVGSTVDYFRFMNMAL